MCVFYLKIALRIDLVLPAVVIAFSVKLLRGEYCINVTDGINSHKMSIMLTPLFRILGFNEFQCNLLNIIS